MSTKKRTSFEQRTRNLPAAEQCKTLSRAMKTRKTALVKAEESLAAARTVVVDREAEVRSCQQQLYKVAFELERAESLRTRVTPPKLELDESSAAMLAALKVSLDMAGAGVEWKSVDSKQVETSWGCTRQN